MTIDKVYYKDGKFLMLPEGQWPRQHEYTDKFSQPHEDDYLKVLASAISKAVPFEDQEGIGAIVWLHKNQKYITIHKDNSIKEGLYTIPETEVEIVEFGNGYFWERVARIKDKKKELLEYSKDYDHDWQDTMTVAAGTEPDPDIILAEQNAMMIVRFLDLNDRIFHYLTYNAPDKTKMTYNEYENILEQITRYRSEYGKGKPVEEETQEELDIEAERFYNQNYSGVSTSQFLKPYIMNSYKAGATRKR